MSDDDVIHDDPLARIRALQGSEVRARLDRMERVKARFLRLNRDDKLATEFQEVLNELTLRADPKVPEGPGNRREGRAIMLVGESGAGKSLSLKRLIGRHPAFPGYMVPYSGCAAVYVRVPSFCTPKAFGRITLGELGLPIKGNPPAHIVWEKIYRRIERRRKVVVHFDEIHNVTRYANEEEIDDIRNMIKTLLVSPTWPIIVVLSGLPEIVALTQPVDEIRRRTRHFEFPSLVLPDDIEVMEEAIADFASVAELPLQNTVLDALIPRLIHAGLYQVGTSIELAQKAICLALEYGADGLTRQHFAEAFAVHTGCLASENPFTMPNWADIDCTAVLGRRTEEIDEDSEDGGRSDRGAGKGKRSKGKRGGRR